MLCSRLFAFILCCLDLEYLLRYSCTSHRILERFPIHCHSQTYCKSRPSYFIGPGFLLHTQRVLITLCNHRAWLDQKMRLGVVVVIKKKSRLADNVASLRDTTIPCRSTQLLPERQHVIRTTTRLVACCSFRAKRCRMHRRHLTCFQAQCEVGAPSWTATTTAMGHDSLDDQPRLFSSDDHALYVAMKWTSRSVNPFASGSRQCSARQ